MARRIFVAPHYDDIALSLGGTVARLTGKDDVWIVTVFGGVPAGELSPFGSHFAPQIERLPARAILRAKPGPRFGTEQSTNIACRKAVSAFGPRSRA